MLLAFLLPSQFPGVETLSGRYLMNFNDIYIFSILDTSIRQWITMITASRRRPVLFVSVQGNHAGSLAAV
jgi:hypothetical protein